MSLRTRAASTTDELSGRRSTGEEHAATVYVPEAFPYLMMKLTAFADRRLDANKDLGRHYALDAYADGGMMIEQEYDRARALAVQSRSDTHFARIREVVAAEFASPTALGVLRLREHPLFRDDLRLVEFAAVLSETFST